MKIFILTIQFMMFFCYSPYVLTNTKVAVNTLNISPTQCVSIVQGEECFVDLKINWQTTSIADYCLFSSLQTKALKCWKNTQAGTLTQEFVTNKNITFTLQPSVTKNPIAKSTLEMAWVYKHNGRSPASWRMF